MIGTAEERAEADRRHEMVRMACAEVGIPVIVAGYCRWQTGTVGIAYQVSGRYRADGRRAVALMWMRVESPSFLMSCVRHALLGSTGCLLVTAAEVARDPSITCGAP